MAVERTKLSHVHGHLDALLIRLGAEDEIHAQAAELAAAAKTARQESAGRIAEAGQDD